MKNRILIFLFLAVVGGCTKDADALKSSLQGTWELTKTYGGWVGERNYAPGNGNTIKFNGNNFVQQIKTTDTAYNFTGTFSVYSGKPCENVEEETLIEFNDDSYASSISIEGQELSIGSTACIADGGNSIYKRISK